MPSLDLQDKEYLKLFADLSLEEEEVSAKASDLLDQEGLQLFADHSLEEKAPEKTLDLHDTEGLELIAKASHEQAISPPVKEGSSFFGFTFQPKTAANSTLHRANQTPRTCRSVNYPVALSQESFDLDKAKELPRSKTGFFRSLIQVFEKPSVIELTESKKSETALSLLPRAIKKIKTCKAPDYPIALAARKDFSPIGQCAAKVEYSSWKSLFKALPSQKEKPSVIELQEIKKPETALSLLPRTISVQACPSIQNQPIAIREPSKILQSELSVWDKIYRAASSVQSYLAKGLDAAFNAPRQTISLADPMSKQTIETENFLGSPAKATPLTPPLPLPQTQAAKDSSCLNFDVRSYKQIAAPLQTKEQCLEEHELSHKIYLALRNGAKSVYDLLFSSPDSDLKRHRYFFHCHTNELIEIPGKTTCSIEEAPTALALRPEFKILEPRPIAVDLSKPLPKLSFELPLDLKTALSSLNPFKKVEEVVPIIIAQAKEVITQNSPLALRADSSIALRPEYKMPEVRPLAVDLTKPLPKLSFELPLDPKVTLSSLNPFKKVEEIAHTVAVKAKEAIVQDIILPVNGNSTDVSIPETRPVIDAGQKEYLNLFADMALESEEVPAASTAVALRPEYKMPEVRPLAVDLSKPLSKLPFELPLDPKVALNSLNPFKKVEEIAHVVTVKAKEAIAQNVGLQETRPIIDAGQKEYLNQFAEMALDSDTASTAIALRPEYKMPEAQLLAVDLSKPLSKLPFELPLDPKAALSSLNPFKKVEEVAHVVTAKEAITQNFPLAVRADASIALRPEYKIPKARPFAIDLTKPLQTLSFEMPLDSKTTLSSLNPFKKAEAAVQVIAAKVEEVKETITQNFPLVLRADSSIALTPEYKMPEIRSSIIDAGQKEYLNLFAEMALESEEVPAEAVLSSLNPFKKAAEVAVAVGAKAKEVITENFPLALRADSSIALRPIFTIPKAAPLIIDAGQKEYLNLFAEAAFETKSGPAEAVLSSLNPFKKAEEVAHVVAVKAKEVITENFPLALRADSSIALRPTFTIPKAAPLIIDAGQKEYLNLFADMALKKDAAPAETFLGAVANAVSEKAQAVKEALTPSFSIFQPTSAKLNVTDEEYQRELFEAISGTVPTSKTQEPAQTVVRSVIDAVSEKVHAVKAALTPSFSIFEASTAKPIVSDEEYQREFFSALYNTPALSTAEPTQTIMGSLIDVVSQKVKSVASALNLSSIFESQPKMPATNSSTSLLSSLSLSKGLEKVQDFAKDALSNAPMQVGAGLLVGGAGLYMLYQKAQNTKVKKLEALKKTLRERVLELNKLIALLDKVLGDESSFDLLYLRSKKSTFFTLSKEKFREHLIKIRTQEQQKLNTIKARCRVFAAI